MRVRPSSKQHLNIFRHAIVPALARRANSLEPYGEAYRLRSVSFCLWGGIGDIWLFEEAPPPTYDEAAKGPAYHQRSSSILLTPTNASSDRHHDPPNHHQEPSKMLFLIFLALTLLEVAFYLIILANILLLLADLLILTVRKPGFALAACVASLVCLSFPTNVAVAMLLAGEVLIVATVLVGQDSNTCITVTSRISVRPIVVPCAGLSRIYYLAYLMPQRPSPGSSDY